MIGITLIMKQNVEEVSVLLRKKKRTSNSAPTVVEKSRW